MMSPDLINKHILIADRSRKKSQMCPTIHHGTSFSFCLILSRPHQCTEVALILAQMNSEINHVTHKDCWKQLINDETLHNHGTVI